MAFCKNFPTIPNMKKLLTVIIAWFSAISSTLAQGSPDLSKAFPNERLIMKSNKKDHGVESYGYTTNLDYKVLLTALKKYIGADWKELKVQDDEAKEEAVVEDMKVINSIMLFSEKANGVVIAVDYMKLDEEINGRKFMISLTVLNP